MAPPGAWVVLVCGPRWLASLSQQLNNMQQIINALALLLSVPQCGVFLGGVKGRVPGNRRNAWLALAFAHAVAAELSIDFPVSIANDKWSPSKDAARKFIGTIAELTMGNYLKQQPDLRADRIKERANLMGLMLAAPDASQIRQTSVAAVVELMNQKMLAADPDFRPFDPAVFGWSETPSSTSTDPDIISFDEV